MNILLLNAGGIGERFGNEVPKQFVSVNNIPIIIYTLKIFQELEEIDTIAISCLPSYIKELKKLCKKYKINKVKYILKGGNTAQESRYNGLKMLYNEYKDNPIIIMHDANRPLVKSNTVINLINACKEYRYSYTGYKINADIMKCDENDFLTTNNINSKGNAFLQMPCAYYLEDIYTAYEGNKHLFDQTSGPSEIISNTGIFFQKLVECSYMEGFKVTYPEDLKILSKYLDN